MKKYLILLLVPFLWNCSDDKKSENLAAETLLDVSYGTDPQQKIDLYLPAGRNENTKVLFLVHGGGWSGGSKADFTPIVPQIRFNFPDYAIVNIGYRLATPESPGYPKQINDIQQVIAHLEAGDYDISGQYAFLGTSAGAHLSMLYSYKFDPENKVKAVCSIVGPTDFTDPAYTENELFQGALANLIGNNPAETLYAETSPITHVDANSPATIQFLGNEDPLVPTSQGTRLKAKLDDASVTNELHIYNAGHGNFNPTDAEEINNLTKAFFEAHF